MPDVYPGLGQFQVGQQLVQATQENNFKLQQIMRERQAIIAQANALASIGQQGGAPPAAQAQFAPPQATGQAITMPPSAPSPQPGPGGWTTMGSPQPINPPPPAPPPISPAVPAPAPGGPPPNAPPAGGAPPGQAPMQGTGGGDALMQRLKTTYDAIKRTNPNADPEVTMMAARGLVDMWMKGETSEARLAIAQLNQTHADMRTLATLAERGREADQRNTTQQRGQDINLYLGGERINVARERIADAGGTGSETPEQREGNAAQAATGQPLSQIIKGYGKYGGRLQEQTKQDAISLIMRENSGMTRAAAAQELSRRQFEYNYGKQSVSQLNTMLGATKPALAQLDFNVDQASKAMAKLKSSDLSPFVNAIIRGEEKWTGDPAYSELYYYMYAAAVESARILSGGQASRAQLAEGAREEAKQWASVGMTTPAMWASVSGAMKAEGQARVQQFEDAIQTQMPSGMRKPGSAPGPSPVGGGGAPQGGGQVLRYDEQGNRIQ